jgi:hypothetical protein
MQNDQCLMGNIVAKLRELVGLSVLDCHTGEVRTITRDELRRRIDKIHTRLKLQAQKQGH